MALEYVCMKPTNSIYSGLPTTIFETMSQLAREYDAINLGQGFPDTDGPEDIRRLAADALMSRSNQYPPMAGVPELRQAVARANGRFYGVDVDWRTEVLVTSGATEALSDTIAALIEPGDEVVLFEPLYDCYLPLLRRAGAVPRLVRLEPPDWQIDPEALAAAFTPRTKAVLVNDPLNPAAKALTTRELSVIASHVIANDAMAICDEVYEHIVFDGRTHTTMMSLPGMRERTVRIGSAGKTLSLTGWKVGYVTATARLLEPIAKAHQYTTFTTPPNLQLAVAAGLDKPDAYFHELVRDLEQKRNRLSNGLARLGFDVLEAAGSYFLVAGYGSSSDEPDTIFARRMTVDVGVTTIPLSAFYETPVSSRYVRFCFSKRDDVLDAAIERLASWP